MTTTKSLYRHQSTEKGQTCSLHDEA